MNVRSSPSPYKRHVEQATGEALGIFAASDKNPPARAKPPPAREDFFIRIGNARKIAGDAPIDAGNAMVVSSNGRPVARNDGAIARNRAVVSGNLSPVAGDGGFVAGNPRRVAQMKQIKKAK